MNSDLKNIYEKLCERHEARFVCDKGSDLLIEGYPRSANTFLVDFISLHNVLKIAHHTHTPKNVEIALELGKPCIVLVRNPADAIISFMIYSGLPVEIAAKRYVDFYEPILNSDKKNFVCGHFDEVVSNPNNIICKVNKKFGVSLNKSLDLEPDMMKAREKDIERARRSRGGSAFIRTVGAPNKDRDRLKAHIKDSVREFVESNEALTSIFHELRNTGK